MPQSGETIVDRWHNSMQPFQLLVGSLVGLVGSLVGLVGSRWVW